MQPFSGKVSTFGLGQLLLMPLLAGLLLVPLLSLSALAQTPPAPTPAADDETGIELSLDEYQQLLANALEQLANGQEAGSDMDQVFAEIQAGIARVQSVRLPSGAMIIVDPLLGTPAGDVDSDGVTDVVDANLSVASARARLAVTLNQIELSSNDNTQARLAVLEQVFARPEFSGPASLIDRLRAWFARLLEALLPEPAPGRQRGEWFGVAASWVAWVVVGIGGLLLAIFLSYWLQKLIGNFIVDAGARRRNAENDEEFATAVEARTRARDSAQSGNYRLAVRQLYLAALLTLEEHGLVAYDRSLTNHEVLDRIRADHPVHAHLRPVVDIFDTVWYGIREPNQETFVDYEQEIELLQSLARTYEESKTR